MYVNYYSELIIQTHSDVKVLFVTNNSFDNKSSSKPPGFEDLWVVHALKSFFDVNVLLTKIILGFRSHFRLN